MKPETRYIILGIMSGTSVDSVDVAACEITVHPGPAFHVKPIGLHDEPIPPRLRARIFEAFADGPGGVSLACSLNFEIGALFAEAAWNAMAKFDLRPKDVTAIASHGQTLYHVPPEVSHSMDAGSPAWRAASTLQVGEGAIIAERTGVDVICDFRTADMAAGGQGAPLVPFADFHLFRRLGQRIIVLNIGGIANVTVLPAADRLDEVTAFDTGPGNMIIDELTARLVPGRSFDEDGRIARSGNVDESILAEWLAHPYFQQAPPKSTGREIFGAQFVDTVLERQRGAAPADLIATATRFTAVSIARQCAEFVFPYGAVTEVLVAGGGAHNPVLVDWLSQELERVSEPRPPQVRLLDQAGFPAKARECVAFALLGAAYLHGIPGNVPSATGARRPRVLGKLLKG